MLTIPAKTIVTRTKNSEWFGAEYNMNIYRGCTHGCIYCDSRSECYGNVQFHQVKAKENALAIIQRELSGKRKKGIVATGSMSDPYNFREREYMLTRQALILLARHGFGAAIATKSPLVTRDIDVLREIQANAPVLVKLTITTPDDALSKKIEPGARTSSQRFAAIRSLAEAGITCGVLLMPVLPFITDKEDSITELVYQAHQNGARFIYPAFGVTLRDVQRDYFYAQLDARFPGLRERYAYQYGGMYSCGSPNAKALWQAFTNACHATGMLYKMSDIIAEYQKGYQQKQVNLFD